jgi:hypothetical protein
MTSCQNPERTNGFCIWILAGLRRAIRPIDGVDPERLPKIGWAVEALTASDQRRADTTHAAEAVSWLTHPEIATVAVNTISALLHKWESERECTGPAREDEDECQE